MIKPYELIRFYFDPSNRTIIEGIQPFYFIQCDKKAIVCLFQLPTPFLDVFNACDGIMQIESNQACSFCRDAADFMQS